MISLGTYRKSAREGDTGRVDVTDLEADPLRQLSRWLDEARAAGWTERVSEDEADGYWGTRVPAAWLSAAASRQSRVLASRAVLEAQAKLGGPMPSLVTAPFYRAIRRLVLASSIDSRKRVTPGESGPKISANPAAAASISSVPSAIRPTST